ncbi:MAG: hypothetical protein WA708_13235, partial [Acidobacteriaceae bacterium]
AGAPALDPTLPKVSLELGGETWHLCYDYAALAIAERKLARAGQFVNMLKAVNLSLLGADRLPYMFFAGLVRSHPEITFAQASALVTMDTMDRVYEAVVDAYLASCPSLKPKEKKKDGDPTEEPAG